MGVMMGEIPFCWHSIAGLYRPRTRRSLARVWLPISTLMHTGYRGLMEKSDTTFKSLSCDQKDPEKSRRIEERHEREWFGLKQCHHQESHQLWSRREGHTCSVVQVGPCYNLVIDLDHLTLTWLKGINDEYICQGTTWTPSLSVITRIALRSTTSLLRWAPAPAPLHTRNHILFLPPTLLSSCPAPISVSFSLSLRCVP